MSTGSDRNPRGVRVRQRNSAGEIIPEPAIAEGDASPIALVARTFSTIAAGLHALPENIVDAVRALPERFFPPPWIFWMLVHVIKQVAVHRGAWEFMRSNCPVRCHQTAHQGWRADAANIENDNFECTFQVFGSQATVRVHRRDLDMDVEIPLRIETVSASELILHAWQDSVPLPPEELAWHDDDERYRTLFGGINLSEQNRAVVKEAHVRLLNDLLPRLRVVERDFSYEEPSRYYGNPDTKPVRKGLTSGGILKDCRNLMAESGTSDVLIVIDLFQKMDPRDEIADSLARDHYRLDVLDQVRKASCYPSRPHGYTIVVISEIRKDAAKTNIDRDDLKGDGRMASDADAVMLMWPDKSAGSATGDIIPTTLRIDKGREGVIRGDVTLWFDHTRCRFHDAKPTGTGDDFHHKNKIQPGSSHTTIDPLAE
jgi:hypothetical protein